jgi:acyl dehydratase
MSSLVTFQDVADVHRATGREVCVTEWVVIDQARIDKFAEATGDFQWIHVDVERARRESPYGRTIAHGFLTMSLIGAFYETYLSTAMPFCAMGLNYGMNRLRFTCAVPVDSRVRGRFVLSKVEDVAQGLQLTFAITIEIEGQEKPALVTESIVRRYPQGPASGASGARPASPSR